MNDNLSLSCVTMPSSLTMENVNNFYELFSGLDKKNNITLDCSSLYNITTPGMQLLFSLSKTLSESGSNLDFLFLGKSIQDSFECIGMKEIQND